MAVDEVRVLLAAVVGIVSFRPGTYTQGSVLGVFIIHFEIKLPLDFTFSSLLP